MDFLPPENNAVSSLLAVIADPKKAQARLDDLNKQQTALNAKVEQARKSELAAEKAQADAERAKAEAESVRDHTQKNLDVAHASYQAKLEELNKSWNEHQTLKAKDLKDLEESKKSLADAQTQLSNKEAEINSREMAVSAKEAEVATLQKDYTTKLAQLKAIL